VCFKYFQKFLYLATFKKYDYLRNAMSVVRLTLRKQICTCDNQIFSALTYVKSKGKARPRGSIIRGRFRKQYTNGNKKSVMAAIGFLFVSLGNSTVQLHYSLAIRRASKYSEAAFSSQNCDRAWGKYYGIAAFSSAISL
jgi:hypothetical protein